MSKQKIDESKYIQQHLANERTYLAWLRTAVAIVGIGFLAVSLHFNYGPRVSEATDKIALAMMLFALIVGLFVMTVGSVSYLAKRKEINGGAFQSISTIVIVVSSAVSILILLLGIYFMTIL
ncbi:YidH family protein [Bacillus songklensis]|uniref:YidH family protein n=1 Tax=Bacillus songklensis TaxID=1069116 RepID=A0ABV8B9W0_9BACI